MTLTSAAGMAVPSSALVFLGVVVLALVFLAIRSRSASRNADEITEPAVPIAPHVREASAPAAPAAPLAPGSAGQLKLHDVPPKTAAMLMAIVAYKTGKPLNELRFISIKEVK